MRGLFALATSWRYTGRTERAGTISEECAIPVWLYSYNLAVPLAASVQYSWISIISQNKVSALRFHS